MEDDSWGNYVSVVGGGVKREYMGTPCLIFL